MTFEVFVAAELPGLSRYARVLTGDRQHAHDVLADVLVAAQLRWDRIGGVDHPAAYLRRMITNAYLGNKRRWSTRHIQVTAGGDLPETDAPDPLLVVDDRSQLHQLLVSLPRQQRAAIVLRHYLDLPDTDIAAELGCTVQAARSYISRGLATLRVTTNVADTVLTKDPS